MPNKTTQTIKQIAFPTVNGTALLDSTKYVWTVNGVSPDPETGSVYISNVDSATVLKSYRTINGTPFNGSANITTQYWGTAINIAISDYLSANTGPETSVNGSTNAVLKLPTTIKANIDGNCTGNSVTATNATNADNLGGYPATYYIRSVNSITPDKHGNVQLRNIGAITGEIKWVAFNYAPDGYLVCNGANVSRTTYADLFAVIGTNFGSGDGSTTFTLPNLMDRFPQGGTSVGRYKSAGLPNITGTLFVRKCGEGIYYTNGTFQNSYAEPIDTSGHWNHGVMPAELHINFNASQSNSIYGNSSTVQPPALTLLPCIKY